MSDAYAMEPAAARMVDWIRGNWITQMLAVAADLAIADQLQAGPVEITSLAERCDVDPEALYRLMRALAALGVFAEEPSGRIFRTTTAGQLLSSSHPQSLRAMARLQGSERYQAWGDLLECIRSGEAAFPKRFGQPVFQWHQSHPEQAAIFSHAMAECTRQEVGALLEVFSLESFSHLIDLGGGTGQALAMMLAANPALQGTLLERPEVISQVAEPPELSERWTTLSGDFFSVIPAGADAYLLKNILHDWSDNHCLTLLSQVRKAVDAGGAALLIYEQLISSGMASAAGKLLDLNMLVVHPGGRERTLVQYEALLNASGFQIEAVHPTRCAMTLIVARPMPLGLEARSQAAAAFSTVSAPRPRHRP